MLKDVDDILKILKNPKYASLLTIFSLKELLIFLLVQKISDNYTVTDIARLLKMKTKEVVTITTDMLKVYNYSKNNMFEEVFEK